MAKKWNEYDYVRETKLVNGKQVSAYGRTQKEAAMKLANKIAKIEAGKVELAGTMTVKEWYDIYNDRYRSTNSDITNNKYEYKMKKYVIDEIGEQPLKKVKPIDCQAIMNALDGKSDDYIKKIYQGMNAMFGAAVDNDLINKNPMRLVSRPKGPKKTRRDITENEREAFIAVTKSTPKYLMFLLMLYCGCRPSEAASIEGRDIIGDRLHIRGTKTAKADRYVPIPSALKKQLPSVVGNINIHTGKKGVELNTYEKRHLLKELRADMNDYLIKKKKENLASDFEPYCLRHAYCCDLQRAGVDIRTAQKLMGHADIKTTANIYTHVDDKMIDKAALLIEERNKAVAQ